MTTFLSQFTPYSFPQLGLVRLPSFVISAEDKAAVGVKPNATNKRFLQELAWKGYLTKRDTGKFANITEDQVKERLRMEFDVLEKTGTIDYILLVWDIVINAKRKGIPVGPGRGSVCNSLTCYLIDITRINSLRHGLNFTRFISEARVKPKMIDGVMWADGRAMCDIDVDFSIERSGEVKDYIDDKYPQRTAKISNITALTGKTALKEVLKVYLEWNDDDAKKVSDLIEVHFGKAEKLADAAEKSPDYKAWLNEHPSHRDAHNRALALEGLVTHKGVHASGLFLSYAPLDETLPVEYNTDDDDIEHLTTSYDMDTVAEIGIKFDKLSLKTLDVIEETCRLANLKVDDIDVNHQSIYDFLGKSRLYYGGFQIESGLAGDATFKAKPRDIEQLSACLAIARPGSLKFIPQLVEYYKTGILKSIYPPIDEILKTTANIIIYQESINRICQEVYGMTGVDADEVRRAISKKKREDIKKWEPIIFAAGDSKGVPKEVTETFWSTCNNSADYLFPQGHSVAYSYLTAQTIYLKANFAKEFYLATLKYAKKEEMSLIIAEARQLGVQILPPSIIHSKEDFAFEGDSIRFGLKHIKGIAAGNLSKVASFKRDFTNKVQVFQFAKQLSLPINVVEILFWSGAFSIDNTPRLRLAIEGRAYNLMCATQQRVIEAFASDYGFDIMETIRQLKEKTDEKGKPMLNPKQLDTFRRKLSPLWTTYQQNIKYEDLFSYLAERALLGFSYSNTLFNLYSRKVEDLVPVAEVLESQKGEKVSFVAFVGEVKKGVGRASKKPYVRFELSEESGNVKAMVNGDNKIQACEQFNGRLPASGDVVVCHGSMADAGGDMIFLDEIILQQNPISLTKRAVQDDPS